MSSRLSAVLLPNPGLWARLLAAAAGLGTFAGCSLDFGGFREAAADASSDAQDAEIQRDVDGPCPAGCRCTEGTVQCPDGVVDIAVARNRTCILGASGALHCLNAVPGFQQAEWSFGRWTQVADDATHMAVAQQSFPDPLRVDGTPTALCYRRASTSEIVCTGVGLRNPEGDCGAGRLGDCAGTRVIQRGGAPHRFDSLHAMVAGDDYFCVVEGERRQVRCFGYHLDDHEDGDTADSIHLGDTFIRDVAGEPVQDVVLVGAARTTTCLVHGPDRQVCCVGRAPGRAEAGEATCRPILGLQGVTSMAAGLSTASPAFPSPPSTASDHFCFLLGTAGEVRCLGGGAQGQVRPFGVGFEHVCRLYESVVSPFMGTDGDALGCDADQSAAPPGDAQPSAPMGQGFDALTAARASTCAARGEEIWCWGEQSLGGDEGVQRLVLPSSVRIMNAGLRHACALTVDERMFCWGNPREGTGLELNPERASCQSTPLTRCP